MLLKSPFPYKPISEGCNFLSGFAFKSKEFSDEGIPVVKIKNIQNNKVDFKESQFYPESLFQLKLDRFRVFHKDVLIAMTGQGSVGRVGQVKIEKNYFGLLNQRVGKFICDENKLNRDYLFYILTSDRYQNHLFDKAVGSGQPNLSPTDIISVEIPFPSYKEQKSIASILSALDDKIELNLQMNKTLEEMAMALYKHWFVDFGPFQDGEFVNSELGKIPKGWDVQNINNLIDVIYGAPFKSKLFNEDKKGYPLIRIRDLKSGSPQYFTEENHIKKTVIHKGDILAGMDALFTPYVWSGEVAVLNQRVVFFKPKYTYIKRRFIYEAVKPWLKFYEGAKVGTTVIHLSKGDIDGFKFIFPKNPAIVESFNSQIEPLHQKIINNYFENSSLTQLRDTLLPKLISGDVRVKEVEKIVTEAL
ncbi:MAG: hypothetical protein GW771_03265 [Flavobacteriia bacterium]|nr:hypothetical protein [Flavobacteriia bacterium]